MKDYDICPCRDGAQRHIFVGGECQLCGSYLKDHIKSNLNDRRNKFCHIPGCNLPTGGQYCPNHHKHERYKTTSLDYMCDDCLGGN